VVFITVQNWLQLKQWFRKYETLNFSHIWLENAYSHPKNWGLGKFAPLNGQQYQLNPKKAHPCASLHCLSHQARKSTDQFDL